VIEYLKAITEELGTLCQNLTNLHLRECAQTGNEAAFPWTS